MPDLTYIHPMVVHFPIALLIVAFIAEVVGAALKKEFFTNAALYLIVIGTLGVIAAYISGSYAGDGIVEGGALKQALDTHKEAAELTMWMSIAIAVVRVAVALAKRFKGYLQWVTIALFFVVVLSIARTGHYGGELVFKHAAGVQLDLGLDSPTRE